MKGSGIRKRSGNVMFFNNPKTLLKKLEFIIGEIMASNTVHQLTHYLEPQQLIKFNMQNFIRNILK